MKITRQQLRRLIEASVIKRGDYVAPIEAPLEDPRKLDFNTSDENKEKLLTLAGSDPDSGNPALADSLADTLGFSSSGRFGAETLSKHMTMYDAGLDLVNDPEIDRLVNAGVQRYFNERRRDSFAIDLDDILKTGYKYPEGPGGFQLYLEGDPNWHEKMPEGFDFNDAEFMTVDEPHLHIDTIEGIMDEIRFLIQVSFKKDHGSNINTELAKDFFKPEEIENTSLGNKLQSLSNLKKAYQLFQRRTFEDRVHFGPAVVQHIYDKAMQPMFEIFTDTIRKHDPKQDMSQVKESKSTISRRQLRRLIEAEVIRKDGVTIPIEDSLADPMKDLDFNPEQKGKLKTLSLKGDQETKAQSDLLADMGGYEGSDRFGVDTFSDQVRLTEADLNKLMKVTDLYNMIVDACDAWIYEHLDYLTYEASNYGDYKTFVSVVVADELEGEEKTDIDDIKGDVYIHADFKLRSTGDDNYAKIMDLFDPSQVSIRLIDQLVYDILTTEGGLYELYFDWRKYYLSGERDIPEDQMTPELKAKIANIKESIL